MPAKENDNALPVCLCPRPQRCSLPADQKGRNMVAEQMATPDQVLAAPREQTPLVHNITNYVVIDFTANALLALGASPVMAHAPNEVEEMAGLAGALVLNIGALEDAWVESMILAGRAANAGGIPVVLDPVGAGATRLRTDAALRILREVKVTVIRGNASEVMALGGAAAGARGVDAVHGVEAARDAAGELAQRMGLTLAISGVVDCITDGTVSVSVANGHALMARITGTGCAATALEGAFAAVEAHPVAAAAAALAHLGLAGERAADQHASPGSFMIGMLDGICEIQPDHLRAGARVRIS
jgi:hydroxyethylthiazole kinase